MAYPNSGIRKLQSGVTYDTIKDYLQSLDIAYARTLGGDNDSFLIPDDWYSWVPTAHHNNPQIFEYIDEFVGVSKNDTKEAFLFYIWGHSFEFENQKNWDRMESICEKLGDKDDTYYATNIAIYDYVNAYYSLKFSADGKTIYNPTLFEIWFECDGMLYCINPGETLKI